MESERIRQSRFFTMILTCFMLLILSNPAASEETYQFERMWPALQQPWYFMDGKIATDKHKFIYLLDFYYNRVQKFTLDGQFVTKWGKRGTGDGEFWAAYDIVTDTEGFVYVTEANRIQKFTPEGQFVTKWESEGGNFNSIAADANGYLYVTDTGNHCVQKFTSAGQLVGKWGEDELKKPGDIEADAKGFIYVADNESYAVYKFSSDGELAASWGSKGTADGEFNDALELTADADGFIYAAEGTRIQKFTSDGEFVTKWGQFGYGDGEFSGIRNVVTDNQGFVYTLEHCNDAYRRIHRIQKFTSDGQFVAKWGRDANGDSQELMNPLDVTADADGFVYVLDRRNYCVHKFTSEGKFITRWGTKGMGDGQFHTSWSIATDNKGFIYVAEPLNYRIQKFTSDGQFVKKWGRKGMRNGEFIAPYDIAVDKDGFIYVADSWRVQKFNSEGGFIRAWGRNGSGDGEFLYANSIAVDGNNIIYVADRTRVQRFTSEGKFIGKWEDKDNIFSIYRIDADAEGFVYLRDLSHSGVIKYTSDGQLITKIGEFGSDSGKFSTSNAGGLYISPTGRLYVSDSSNYRIQVFKPGLPTDRKMKAIVVAGRKDPSDSLWDATQICTNFAYRALTYQGFSKETIYYLSSDMNADLDGNGEADEVDAAATKANLQHAITAWAADADSLVLYITDHGGDETFRINESEDPLTAEELDSWLDALQTDMTGKVTVVYDACESGSFLSKLTPPADRQRIVITSTSPEEPAFFVTQGSVSFSSFFWTHIFNGLDIRESFELAKETMDSQYPLLDANGDGVGNDPEDLDLVRNLFIGSGTKIWGEGPVIGSVSPDQTLNDTTSATLSAFDVTDPDGVSRVWAVIRPPDYNQGAPGNPIDQLPTIDLVPGESGQYGYTYDGFNTEGTYRIAIYARDGNGNPSVPKLTSVTVVNPLKRRAIIVAGDSVSDTFRTAVENNAGLAYDALIFQGYIDEDIYFMSPTEFSTGVDGLPTQSNLKYAVETWGAEDTYDLVIYMVGIAQKDAFRLNDTETLSPGGLGQMLDTLQNSREVRVTVIYDACASGSFLSSLTTPDGKERILIASTDGEQPASFLSGGFLSFSQFFWNNVIDGVNIKDAFVWAAEALKDLGQTPILDADNDGIFNERMDERIARNYSIGASIIMAGDEPVIGSVSPHQTLDGESSATIWAENITATSAIESVWAVVVPPGYDMGSCSDSFPDLPKFELNESGNGRYEFTYSDFSEIGTYLVLIYATDTPGNVSSVVETQVMQMKSPSTPDIPEPPAEEPEEIYGGVSLGEGDWINGDEYRGEVGSLTLDEENSATIWVSVSDEGEVKDFWAVIAPPGQEIDPFSESFENLPKVSLNHLGDGRYAITYSGFSDIGTYQVGIYGTDANGDDSQVAAAQVEKNTAPVVPPEDDDPGLGDFDDSTFSIRDDGKFEWGYNGGTYQGEAVPVTLNGEILATIYFECVNLDGEIKNIWAILVPPNCETDLNTLSSEELQNMGLTEDYELIYSGSGMDDYGVFLYAGAGDNCGGEQPPAGEIMGGTFTMGESGLVEIEWLYDGGMYQGELGIFSLSGMDDLTPGSEAFIKEAARRALSNNADGYVVLSDPTEKARFSGLLGGESTDWNSGVFRGKRPFSMRAGDTFATILVPNASLEALFNEPGTTNPYKRPLFSLVSSNPAYGMSVGQVADISGHGRGFVYEDIDAASSDMDYNDLIIQITGAESYQIPTLDKVIYAADSSQEKRKRKSARESWRDWRTDTELGRLIMQHVEMSDPESDMLRISAVMDSSADLLIYDLQGRLIGKYGGDIPGASIVYDQNGAQTVSLPVSQTDGYAFCRLVLHGKNDCTAQLTVKAHQGEREILSETIGGVGVSAHQVLVSYGWISAEDLLVDFGVPEVPTDGNGNPLFYDFNGDGDIDDKDIEQIASLWNTCEGDPEYDAFFDLNEDGCINILDISAVVNSKSLY